MQTSTLVIFSMDNLCVEDRSGLGDFSFVRNGYLKILVIKLDALEASRLIVNH